MVKNTSDPYVKIKTMEVSSRSWFGAPSDMDKAIEKWVNDGWQLVQKDKIPNGKYLLTFEYEMSDEEIKAQQANQKNSSIGCLALFFIIFVFFGLSGLGNNKVTQTPNFVIPTQNMMESSQANRSNVVAQSTISIPTATPLSGLRSSNRDTLVVTPIATRTPRPTRTPLPTRTSLPAATEATMGRINAVQNVNLREEPSTNAPIVTGLNPNTQVTILGQSNDGEWFNVLIDGQTEGWIAAFLVEQLSGVEIVQSTLASPTPRPSREVADTCTPNFRRLSGYLRYSSTYSESDYTAYNYDIVGLAGDYDSFSIMIYVGDDWRGPNFPLTTTFDSYAGQINVRNVLVHHGFEGDEGWNYGMNFSFEYKGLKYSGSVDIFDDYASSAVMNELKDGLDKLIQAIQSECR